jgi:hypothetical protein
VAAWDWLRLKHVTPKYDKNTGEIVAAKVIIYAGEPEEYFTFITPEAYTALSHWMDYRKSYGETITPESWLMRNLWKTTNTNWGARWGLATVPKQLKSGAIKRLLERALCDMGLRKPLPAGVKRHEFKATHGMCKFYDTQAKAAKMLSNMVEKTIGHSLGVAENYDRFTEEQILEEYLKAVPSLTINDDEYVLKAKLQEKVEQLTKILERQDDLEVRFMEVLRIAKLKGGMIGKDRTILDQDRNITAKYVDDRNQIRTVKFPIDSIEIFDGDAEDNKSN